MTIKMEAITELPEIKSELNTDDFGSHSNVVTTSSQPQQHQEHQQNNCQQWVSSLLQQFLSSEIPFFKTRQKALLMCLNIGGPTLRHRLTYNLPSSDNPLRSLCGLIVWGLTFKRFILIWGRILKTHTLIWLIQNSHPAGLVHWKVFAIVLSLSRWLGPIRRGSLDRTGPIN